MSLFDKIAKYMEGHETCHLDAKDSGYIFPLPDDRDDIDEIVERARYFRINRGPWITRAEFEATIDAALIPFDITL